MMRSKRMWFWCFIGLFGIVAGTAVADGSRTLSEERGSVPATLGSATASSTKVQTAGVREAPGDGAVTARGTLESREERTLVESVRPYSGGAAGGVADDPNDDCVDQVALVGEGVFQFDNTGATEDGPDHEACDFFGEQGIDHDLWYCWVAASSCNVTVDTCGQTNVDTKIAVYDGCTCPTVDTVPLECNDDACGLQSSVSFHATIGHSYLIRLGTLPGAAGGTGTFTTECAPSLLCDEPPDHCQLPDDVNANNSDRTHYLVADGFTPDVGDPITSICWWGAYFDGSGDCQGSAPDTFEVKYYTDAGGMPGTLIGAFSQVGGTLTVAGPADTGNTIVGLSEYEYTGTHAPVQVDAGQCYWIEISNSVSDTACSWYWEFGLTADGRVFQDGDPPDGYGLEDIWLNDQAFCVNRPLLDGAPACIPPPPDNDDCANSVPIFDGVTYFDTTSASTDGNPEPTCGFVLDDDQINQDIWFDHVATCDAILQVSLCGSLYDTKLAVYAGSECLPSAPPVECNDDFCGDLGLESQVSLPVTQGEVYKIRVGGFLQEAGPGRIAITCAEPPPNDNCEDLTEIPDLSPGGASLIFDGNNENANNDCELFGGAHVWVAFNLLSEGSVTVDYAGTDPHFADAWGNLALGCPCTGFTPAGDCVFRHPPPDENWSITWYCLSPGVYYYPVLAEPGSQGPYHIEVTAVSCIDPCANATGDCFAVHDTPGCDDPTCCDTVCDVDPYCCCVEWDDVCVAEAEDLCGLADICAAATGDCCLPQQGVGGCADFDCCMAVCVCDPFCCNVEWDEACATDGFGETQCGANFQCGSLCRECEDGDVTWVDPIDGIIDPLAGWVDARQPYPVGDATTLQGLSAITVYAPAGADIVDCWTLCETNQNPAMHPPGLLDNDITSIADNGDGTFTLTLDRVIMPGEVTELTYTSSSGSTVSSCRFIAHPADVDADETSAPADILAVIDSLNGVIPRPDNLADLDRDGDAAPADILRVIDLLNGAGEFEVWLDVTVDHDAPCPE